MEEDNDSHASILQVCKPTTPTTPSSSTSTVITPLCMRFVDHSLDADGTIIPPASIGAYLCPSPENEESINDNTVIDDNCIIDGQGQHHDHNDFLYDRDPPAPPCLVSYQILSPPSSIEYPLGSLHSLDLATDYDIIDGDYSSDTNHDGLWLSQLKSMATQQGLFFDHAISIVTKFRSSKYRLSLSPSPSVSSLWLSQLKSMATQQALFFDHAVSLVTQFRASKYRLSLSPSPPLFPAVSNLWLSQLKSMATQQALLFHHAVSVVTQFRASRYRLSLSLSPCSSSPMELPPKWRKGVHSLKMPKHDFADLIEVVPSKSSSEKRGLASLFKSKRKKVLADPPLKKQKHFNSYLDDIESSTSNIGSELNELERASVFFCI